MPAKEMDAMAGQNPEIRSEVVIGGEKDFKGALSDISSGLKILKSDMSATQSAFEGQEKSIDALLAKQQNQTKQYELQAQKVELYSRELEKALETEGTSEKTIERLTVQYNNSKTAMNKAKAAIDTTTKSIEEQTTIQAKQDKSVEGLTKSQKALAKQYLEQSKSVDAYSKKLETALRTEGTSQDTLDKLNAEYLKAKAALKETAVALDKNSEALDKAKKAEEKETEQTKEATKETGRFKEAMSAAGEVIGKGFVASAKACAAALAAVGAAAGAAVKAGFDMSVGAGKMADDILTLSDQTGVSAQNLQKWTYAAEFMDTPVETITGSMAKLTKQMGNAQGGSKEAQKAFKQLGVSFKDSSGHLRDSEEVFGEAIDALGRIPNEAERDALAMKLFGKSAQDLNPLIKTGSMGLAELGNEATRMGAVFSDKALAAMGGFDDSMQRMKGTMGGLKNTIGLALIPAFQPLVDAASGAMADVSYALKDGLQPGELEPIMDKLMGTLSGVIDGLLPMIKKAIPLISSALNTVVGVVARMLPGLLGQLLPAAMGLLQTLVDSVMANIGPITELATSLITSLASFLMDNIPALLDGAVAIVAGLATGIGKAMPKLLPAAARMIAAIAKGLATNLPILINGGITLLTGIVDGLIGALPILIEAIPEVVTALVDALTTALPMILDGGGDILNSLIKGVTDAIPLLTDAIPQILTALLAALTTALPTILSGGTDILNSIIKGITDALPLLTDAIPQVITAIVDALVTALPQILSEGTNILNSLITGITDAIPTLTEKLPEVITAILTALVDALPKILAEGGNMIASLITGLGDAIPTLIEKMPEIVDAIWNGLQSVDWITLGLNLIQGLVGGLESAVTSLLSAIEDVFKGIWAAILKVFGIASPSTEAESAADFILKGLVGGFESAVDAVVTKVKEIFGKIWDAIKSIFGFGSGESEESKEAKAAGTDIMTGMQDGITGNKDELEAAVANVSKDALAKFVSEFGIANGTSSKTKPYGTALVKGIDDGLKSKAEAGSFPASNDVATAAANAFNAAFGVAGTGFAGLGEKSASKFEYIGKAVCQGIANGIASGKSLITTAAENAAQAAYDAAANKLGIHSPSRAMAELGRYATEGFAQGMERNLGMVMDAANRLSNMATRGASARGGAQSTGIDYTRMADELTASMQRAGLDRPSITLDGHAFGGALEPSVSQATQRRVAQSATGRVNRVAIA